MAQQGHAAGTASHDAGDHRRSGCTSCSRRVWLGGLLTIVLLRASSTPDRLPIVLAALLDDRAHLLHRGRGCRATRAPRSASAPGTSLLTPYGVLVLVKVVALLALGLFGAFQRRFLIGRMQRSPPGAGRRSTDSGCSCVVELAFMGIASGVAAALARTATAGRRRTPPARSPATPAEILTGQPLPPWPELDALLHRVEPRPALAAARARSASSSTSRACGGCAGAAIAGPCTARCSGWPACCCSSTSRTAA